MARSCPALQGPGLSQHTRAGPEAAAVTLEALRHGRSPRAAPPSIPRLRSSFARWPPLDRPKWL